MAAVALAPSWLGVYFPLRMHAAAEKSDPFSLDIRGVGRLAGHRTKLFYNKQDGPKQKGTQNRKQTAIYWSLLWGVCVLKILNTTTSLKNKEVGLLSICASLNIE